MIKESKHTPGPWYKEKGFDAMYIKNTPDGLSAFITVLGETWEQAEANCNLVLAAHDLLEELESLVENADSYKGPRVPRIDSLFDKARVAIAKAKGG